MKPESEVIISPGVTRLSISSTCDLVSLSFPAALTLMSIVIERRGNSDYTICLN